MDGAIWRGLLLVKLYVMQIKNLFVLNPDENNLMNDGVVNINSARDENGLKTIRHELKTFVCEGEYQKGIYRILDTYLKYIDRSDEVSIPRDNGKGGAGNK